MKRIILLLAIFLMVASVAMARSGQKPLPPVSISIAPTQADITPGKIVPGQSVEFKVAARSFINSAEMTITIELTGGAELVSGEISWSGAAAKDEEKTLIFTVRAPDKGTGAIRAVAAIKSPDGPKLLNVARYALGGEAKRKPEQEHPVKKDGKGRNIIEYR